MIQKERADRLIALIALLLGAVVVSTTIYGVRHFYSPVVFWDEWDGYLGFYKRILEGGGWHEWWRNHVDHRIITSRVLFLLDLRYFHGNHIILFAAQLLMLAALVFIIAFSGSKDSQPLAIGLGAALLFSWSQNEILRWGFETQVIAAVLFSVWSLRMFCQTESSPLRRFISAYALALLAEFSMGSGLGAPVILIGATIVMRRPLREFALTVVLAAVMISVYFIGFVKPEGPAPAPIAGGQLYGLAKFFFLAAANPLSQIDVALRTCMIVGAVTSIAAASLCLWIWWTRQVTRYRAFLICVIAFAYACVAMVTIGRASGGLSQAILSRYTTAPLLAWLAFALLAYDTLPAPRRTWIVGIVLALATWTALGQRQVNGDNEYLYTRKLGILSNKIGLDQPDLLWQVYPQAQPWRTRFVADSAFGAEHKLGIYSAQWLQDAGTVKFDQSKLDGSCRGFVDHATRGTDGTLIVSGWMLAERRNTLIVLVDGKGETVGYGVTGSRREDVVKQLGARGEYSGWIGFAKTTADSVSAYGYEGGAFCRISGV